MPLSVVDGPLGQSSQIVNDVLKGGVLISLFHKQLRGDRQDLFHRLLRVLVSGHTGPPFIYIPSVCFVYTMFIIPCQGRFLKSAEAPVRTVLHLVQKPKVPRMSNKNARKLLG